MKKLTKIVIRVMFAAVLLATGFAVAFPIGQQIGFTTGSEWAIKQAEIVAREAGVFMPISYESGQFHIVLRQPNHLYTMAWKLADRHDAEVQCAEQDEKEQVEITQATQRDSRFAKQDDREQVKIIQSIQPDSRLAEQNERKQAEIIQF